MGDIYEFDTIDTGFNILTEPEIKKQEELLKNSIWYHGTINRGDAESRIINNGEFLVRFSQEIELKFVVTSKWNGKFIHIAIKTDVDSNRKLVYFIDEKFKYSTVFDLIMFHKENQYPLSDTSEAVLYKPIDPNNGKNLGALLSQRESKFRKSGHTLRKHPEKRNIPRCGSETYLTNRYSANNFPELNKSLTNLSKPIDLDAPNKPKKPSFKLLNSKHLLLKLRPSNIKIRNKKLYKESGDYTDYMQVKDCEGALKREHERRGVSLGNRSPSLFGLIMNSQTGKKNSVDESIYVFPDNHDNDRNNADSYGSRYSTMTLTPDTVVASKEINSDYVYGISGQDIDSPNITLCPVPVKKLSAPPLPYRLGLLNFVNLNLASHRIAHCGPVESTFDKAAINRVAHQLLTTSNSSFVFCKHLVDELDRIFTVAGGPLVDWKTGYRWAFLPLSEGFQRDLSIRQTTLTHFIMATIVSTASTETRINLIFFWIKCADYLLTRFRDMFHFMAVFSAIFSDQILNLRVWKLVYRQDSSMKNLMESFKEAIKSGCLGRTDIDKCIPDLAHLCNVFLGNEDDFEVVTEVSFNITKWSDQEFSSPNTWLKKLLKEINGSTTLPLFRELVQTESLLCLILGKSSMNHNDIDPLFEKVSDCIRMMVKVCNES